ncbi:MAG: response regulator [Chthoniobacterales bacterium]|nr:response regulator [Chthoniobacterales bacterium]
MKNGQSVSPEETERAQIVPEAASELNNLIQIISSTVVLLEKMWKGPSESEEHFEVLRTSVDRAAKVTARLVQHAGGTNQKNVLHCDLAAGAEARPAPKKPGGNQRCILVVDDEPMALALSRYVLAQAGFAVATAQSGLEAIDLFGREPNRFSLVLLDLSMPSMDGEETFVRLRAINPKVPVLLNTGFIEKHRLERMMDAGLAGFLRRPYQPDDVLEQIGSVLESAPA